MTGPTQKAYGNRDPFTRWDPLSASVGTPQIPAASSHNQDIRPSSDRDSFDALSCSMAGWDAFTHPSKLPNATTSQKPLDAGGDTANQAK